MPEVEILSRYRPRIMEALAEALEVQGPLRQLLRYPLGLTEPDGQPGPGIGGKLLRPALVCFSCEALGGEVETTLLLAVALELVHNFSLVHDDIQDEDELRRGRPTAWKVFGTAQAINAGDGLLVQALLTVSQGRHTAVPFWEALLSATFRMIEGQALDLALEGQVDGGVEEYLEMARRKTGALFGCAFELGALAAGRPELARQHFHLGETLGLSFQTRDDILGIWGDAGETGKPVGADLLRRKRSFALAFALERDPSFALLLRQNPVPVWEAMARLEESGAREAAEAQVKKFSREAREIAQGLPWSPWARRAFGELLAFLAKREV